MMPTSMAADNISNHLNPMILIELNISIKADLFTAEKLLSMDIEEALISEHTPSILEDEFSDNVINNQHPENLRLVASAE